MLSVHNLHASIADTPILKGVSLAINSGAVHVVMGPNGSGKSTLANIIMGNPRFAVTGGKVVFQDTNITELSPDERAALGLFMAFQYPREVSGVQLDRFLYLCYSSIAKARGEHDLLNVFDFNKQLETEAAKLNMKPELVHRSLNEGFSGGEKKKCEMLQLAMLNPRLAILDETDSGLDVDALKVVGEAVNRYRRKDNSILIITHYNRILDYITPDVVHIMRDGKIIKSGDAALAQEIEAEGFENFVITD